MKFYVNRNPRPNGDHKIHCSTCGWRPNAENCIDLGDLADSRAAMREARRHYPQVTCCPCCRSGGHMF